MSGEREQNPEQSNLAELVEQARDAILAGRPRAVPLPYAAPDRRANPAPEPVDTYRQATAVGAALLLLITVLAFGPQAQQRTGSDLLNDATIQPWLLVLLAVAALAHAGFGWLSAQRSARRQRAATPYAIATWALFAVALTFAAAFLPLPATGFALCATISALLAIRQLNRHTARSWNERVLCDAPLGLAAGYLLFLTAQWILPILPEPLSENAWAALGLIFLATLVATSMAHSERGRHSVALGFTLPLLLAAVMVFLDHSAGWWLGLGYGLLAIVVALSAENRRYQINHAEHRALRGEELDF
ncbi:hypothetical protein GCM10027417_21670 [Glutamicibacter endophyticus]